MTDIRMTNDKIVFDGHADTRQECETITLMCDNLAKSKDFKTIRYESGYAEFEKIGKTDELKFLSNADITINFDSHITKVTSNMNLSEPTPTVTTATWTTSGENVGVLFGGANQSLNVVLADGYVIDSVTGTETPLSQSAQPITFSEITDNSFTFSLQDGADYTITITSKIPATKQTIDVSTLSGWANLSTGNHQITVKTKASGYADSAASNAVTVSKAASVSAGKLYFSGDEDMGNTPTATVNGVAVSNGYQLKFGDVIVITTTNGDSSGYRINGEYIGTILGDYTTPYVVNWTEGGDINYTEIGMGPGSTDPITINYLNPTT